MNSDKKIKIVWFCSSLIKKESEVTGLSWVHSLAHHLVGNKHIELYNICEGMVSELTHHSHGSIQQWEFPAIKTNKNGLPVSAVIRQISDIVNAINPDLIHYWGTESFWPLLSARGILKTRALLEIQGLKFTCYPFFSMGMSTFDKIQAIGIRELLKPNLSISRQQKDFFRWGEFEKEMIRSFNDISIQSDWAQNEIRSINSEARIHRSNILLRSGFSTDPPWQLDQAQRFRIFTSATSSTIPYKGFHILVDAVHKLKARYPNVTLAIAGFRRKGIRKTGYERWVDRKIRKYGLECNIQWLGQLSETELITELKKAHICAITSFVESYSLAMDESLTLGVPTIASDTTAMPELADKGKNALLAQPGNPQSFADAATKIFESDEIAGSLSRNALKSRRGYHSQADARFQLEIYGRLLNVNLRS